MTIANAPFSSSAAGHFLGQNDLSRPPLTPPDMQHSDTVGLMTRMASGAHETIDSIAERAAPPLESLEQGIARTGNVLQHKVEQWRTTGDEWAQSLRGSVREHPLVAVAASLALGAVLARLLRGRHTAE